MLEALFAEQRIRYATIRFACLFRFLFLSDEHSTNRTRSVRLAMSRAPDFVLESAAIDIARRTELDALHTIDDDDDDCDFRISTVVCPILRFNVD